MPHELSGPGSMQQIADVALPTPSGTVEGAPGTMGSATPSPAAPIASSNAPTVDQLYSERSTHTAEVDWRCAR